MAKKRRRRAEPAEPSEMQQDAAVPQQEVPKKKDDTPKWIRRAIRIERLVALLVVLALGVYLVQVVWRFTDSATKPVARGRDAAPPEEGDRAPRFRFPEGEGGWIFRDGEGMVVSSRSLMEMFQNGTPPARVESCTPLLPMPEASTWLGCRVDGDDRSLLDLFHVDGPADDLVAYWTQQGWQVRWSRTDGREPFYAVCHRDQRRIEVWSLEPLMEIKTLFLLRTE